MVWRLFYYYIVGDVCVGVVEFWICIVEFYIWKCVIDGIVEVVGDILYVIEFGFMYVWNVVEICLMGIMCIEKFVVVFCVDNKFVELLLCIEMKFVDNIGVIGWERFIVDCSFVNICGFGVNIGGWVLGFVNRIFNKNVGLVVRWLCCFFCCCRVVC